MVRFSLRVVAAPFVRAIAAVWVAWSSSIASVTVANAGTLVGRSSNAITRCSVLDGVAMDVHLDSSKSVIGFDEFVFRFTSLVFRSTECRPRS
jgi:hypothetical protein